MKYCKTITLLILFVSIFSVTGCGKSKAQIEKERLAQLIEAKRMHQEFVARSMTQANRNFNAACDFKPYKEFPCITSDEMKGLKGSIHGTAGSVDGEIHNDKTKTIHWQDRKGIIHENAFPITMVQYVLSKQRNPTLKFGYVIIFHTPKNIELAINLIRNDDDKEDVCNILSEESNWTTTEKLPGDFVSKYVNVVTIYASPYDLERYFNLKVKQ